MVPTKKDIAFVEYYDEASATNAKDALHNYKMDGENKIKVRRRFAIIIIIIFLLPPSFVFLRHYCHCHAAGTPLLTLIA